MDKTLKEFNNAMKICSDIFINKSADYGPSWRVMRPSTLTDQLLIKARRIRQLEISRHSAVGEGILPEFIAIVNYGLMALIQLKEGPADHKDMSSEQAVEQYSYFADKARELMLKKNTDYGEAWRDMRISSYTDLILSKLERIKEIEDNNGRTEVSEGIDSNYFDIINYAVFGIIRLSSK